MSLDIQRSAVYQQLARANIPAEHMEAAFRQVAEKNGVSAAGGIDEIARSLDQLAASGQLAFPDKFVLGGQKYNYSPEALADLQQGAKANAGSLENLSTAAKRNRDVQQHVADLGRFKATEDDVFRAEDFFEKNEKLLTQQQKKDLANAIGDTLMRTYTARQGEHLGQTAYSIESDLKSQWAKYLDKDTVGFLQALAKTPAEDYRL